MCPLNDADCICMVPFYYLSFSVYIITICINMHRLHLESSIYIIFFVMGMGNPMGPIPH
jgi:hypothetical protein